MTTFKPTLAGKPNYATLRFPCYASVKVDGLRCTVRNGVPYSRSQKVLPNRFLQAYVKEFAAGLNGFDGELVVGDLTAPDCYRASMSGIMSESGEPDFTFWVFDSVNFPGDSYENRYRILHKAGSKGPGSRVVMLPQALLHNLAALDTYEAEALAAGHEGVMLRDPYSNYKQGRATAIGQELLKVKRFADAEATVVGVREELHNGNRAETNEVGRTQRSSHQENKTGKGALGALICRGLTDYPGMEFDIGTGFSAAQRADLWGQDLIGKIAKYKHFPVGAHIKPRHPVFLGWRNPIDMS